MIDATGNPSSTIVTHDEHIVISAPAPNVYKPAPGRVTVLRHEVDHQLIKNDALDLVKDTYTIEVQTTFNIHATVASIGDPIPGGIAAFFKKGDHITIEPSSFREVRLSPELTVWVGPIGAVTGVFADAPTYSVSTDKT